MKNRIFVRRWHDIKQFPNAIYIGRGSPLGNPYKLTSSHPKERKEVIEKYKTYFYLTVSQNKNLLLMTELNKIRQMLKKGDVYLGCFCHPKPCHGDVIKEYILNG